MGWIRDIALHIVERCTEFATRLRQIIIAALLAESAVNIPQRSPDTLE